MYGFFSEDYALMENIRESTDYPILPSVACDIAGEWAAIKIRKRAKTLRDAGCLDQSSELEFLARRIERGEL